MEIPLNYGGLDRKMYARNKTNLHSVFHILFREHAGELELATFGK